MEKVVEEGFSCELRVKVARLEKSGDDDDEEPRKFPLQGYQRGIQGVVKAAEDRNAAERGQSHLSLSRNIRSRRQKFVDIRSISRD